MAWAGARKETSFFRSRNSTPLFALSDSLNSSVNTLPNFYYGSGASEVITGDWDGNLGDGIGLYDPTTWTFYLRNCPCGGGNADMTVRMGNFGDKPIAGDWDGDGRDDIGVYRPSNSTFYFHMLDGDTAPAPIVYGDPGDLPIIGDWNGDGRDDIGVYRPSNVTFYKITGGAVPFGNFGDIPVVGDWTPDGVAEIGVYRPSNSTFYFLTVSDTHLPVPASRLTATQGPSRSSVTGTATARTPRESSSSRFPEPQQGTPRCGPTRQLIAGWARGLPTLDEEARASPYRPVDTARYRSEVEIKSGRAGRRRPV